MVKIYNGPSTKLHLDIAYLRSLEYSVIPFEHPRRTNPADSITIAYLLDHDLNPSHATIFHRSSRCNVIGVFGQASLWHGIKCHSKNKGLVDLANNTMPDNFIRFFSPVIRLNHSLVNFLHMMMIWAIGSPEER